MVTAVTSFGRSGLSDWLIQRFTAVVLAAYFIFMVCYLFTTQGLGYEQWHALHTSTCMRIFNTLTLLSLVAHAWIGMWGVLTDYITDRMLSLKLGVELGGKATGLRLFFVVCGILLLAVYTLWGIEIIWGF